ncbi:MAG: SET domain-containing protein-lysine N-methyltransferase, partial [Desulfuromonadales bacterium]
YRGVFATDSISAGDRLAIFGGKIIRADEEVGDYGLQIDETFVINAFDTESQESDDGFFFNHSCDPNSGIKGSIFLLALRDIEPDEEVTFDYAMCLHRVNGLPPYNLECLCGKENCRKIVTDDDWKLPELQKRYDGWFSWYLQEKIDQIN